MYTEAWSDDSSSLGSIGSPNLVNDGMGCGVAAAWSMGRHFTFFGRGALVCEVVPVQGEIFNYGTFTIDT